MQVYELAKELGIRSKKVLELAKTSGVEVTHQFSGLSALEAALIRSAHQRLRAREAVVPLPPGKIVIAPPDVAPVANLVPSRFGAASLSPPRGKGPVVAFASLKGGVGKTTMSLCAAELLRSWQPRTVERAGLTAPPPTTWPVALIDADVAGTELHWVWNERCGDQDGRPIYKTTESLIDLFEERADLTDVFSRLMDDAKALAQEPIPRGLIVPTFTPGREMHPSSLEWKQILELAGTFVQRVMVRVIEKLRDAGCAVVVDLPAFDVGFARYAANAVREVKGHVFMVTDCDMRSLRSTQHWLLANLPDPEGKDKIWRHVVLNRSLDRSWRDRFQDRVGAVAKWGNPGGEGADTSLSSADFTRPVVAEGVPGITQATHFEGGPRKLFEAISDYIAPTSPHLEDADRRRLRGDAESPK